MKKKLPASFLTVLIAFSAFSQSTSFTKETIVNEYDTAANPYVMDSGHLNEDVYPDIVVGTLGGTVEIFINNGNGTFASPVVKALSQVTGVHIEDLDGVNGNDVIASSFNGNKLVWYANNNLVDDTFGVETEIVGTLVGPGAIVSGDIDDDGDVDVATMGYYSNEVVWFANDGSGGFPDGEEPITSVTNPGDIDIADFDGDGYLDFVVANSVLDVGTVEVYYNDLDPPTVTSVTFTKAGNSVSTGNAYLFDISFADIDDDGKLDILKTDSGYDPGPIVPGEVAWYSESGGIFTENIITTSLVNFGGAIAADMDNDGDNDVIISNGVTLNDDIIWFESIGTAPTTRPNEYPVDPSTGQLQIFEMTIDDFNNDGYLDIASISYQNDDLNWFSNDFLLGIDDNAINEISIYPNPTKNKLNFKGNFSESLDVSVYDILGKNILQNTVDLNTSLDVSKLHSGLYIIKFKGYSETYKFVKE